MSKYIAMNSGVKNSFPDWWRNKMNKRIKEDHRVLKVIKTLVLR